MKHLTVATLAATAFTAVALGSAGPAFAASSVDTAVVSTISDVQSPQVVSIESGLGAAPLSYDDVIGVRPTQPNTGGAQRDVVQRSGDVPWTHIS